MSAAMATTIAILPVKMMVAMATAIAILPVKMMVAMIQNQRDIAIPLIAPSTRTISVNTWDHLKDCIL